MGELKPCPFCGSEDVSLSCATTLENVVSHRFVECSDCGTGGPINPAEHLAIAAWNRRPSPTPAPDDLREAVARIIDPYARMAAKCGVATRQPDWNNALAKADAIHALLSNTDDNKDSLNDS